MVEPGEQEPAELSDIEGLDEDELGVDPLEKGMDPPEHWSGADRYGTTPYEQSHPQDLDHRLREEEPDGLSSDVDDEDDVDREAGESADDLVGYEPEAARRGQSADQAGGSVAETIRTPEESG